jgi:hypothetical protein
LPSAWLRRCRHRERSLKTSSLLRAAVLASLALSLLSLASATQAAADSTPAAYRQAVQDALTLARGAAPNDSATAQVAARILQSGTGSTQPEILTELESTPPDFDSAVTRLESLLDALDRAADTTEPAQAQQRLDAVLAMSRYDALHRPPSWFDQLRQWVSDRINDLLNLLRGEAGSAPLPSWFYYALGVIVVGVLAILIFNSTRGRLAEGATAARLGGPRAPADYFAEADRMAAAGDRVGAIRALCAGVAATLAGERTWEGSPLTVREIFQRAQDPHSLHPLLFPFEAAIYGGRDVDKATYERALQVAARFRQAKELAA